MLFRFPEGAMRRGGISLLVIAVVLLSLISGITVMFTQQRLEEYPVFTTADEANAVFGRHRVPIMSRVCMIDIPEDYDGLKFYLYTGDCTETTRNYHKIHINGSTNVAKGYYFSFLSDSTVDVSYAKEQSATSKCHMSNKPKKAKDLDCGGGSEFHDSLTISDSGYYLICIIPPESVTVNYSMDVTQYYYERKATKVCNDVIQGPDHKHKCCHFGLSDSRLHCVYLTVNATVPRALSKLPNVQVYMQYNDSLRILTIVALVVAILASCVVIVAVYCVQFGRRRLEPA